MEKRSILIADDEMNLCRILDAELRKAGYSVTSVHDGCAAIERAKEFNYQIIILDVRMPMLDGISALREIRKIRKDTPIIIMTAYENHDTMASALSMGATACVNKPFDLESLVALVKASLDEGNGQKSISWSGSVRTVLFNKNQPVLVEVHDGEYTGQYQCRIEDKDDQTLSMSCPRRGASCALPRVGTPLSIGFAGEDAFYSFETAVLACREGDSPAITVGKPAVIYRVQRRKYRRTMTRIPVDVAIVQKGSSDGEIAEAVRFYTEDIGVGGCKIVTQQRLPDGAEVRIQTDDVPGMARFSGTGRIARAREVYVNSHTEWEYGIQFTKVDEETRCQLRKMTEMGAIV